MIERVQEDAKRNITKVCTSSRFFGWSLPVPASTLHSDSAAAPEALLPNKQASADHRPGPTAISKTAITR